MFTTQNIADTYDQIGLNFSATREKLSPEIISLLPKLKNDARVLDLGCGNGVLLTALPDGINYTGLDISQTLIQEAKRKHPNQEFVLADLLDNSAWDKLGRYDLIVALAVFHHLPAPDDHFKLLQSIKQHLNPNGTVLISNWRLLQAKFDHFRTDPKHLAIPFHNGINRNFYAFTDSELHEKIRDLGFTQTKSITAKDNLYLVTKLGLDNK